jgi:hypothetical protein
MTRIRQHLLAEDGIRACAYVNADKDVQTEFLQIKVKAQARRDAEKATAARKSKTTDEEVAADAARAHANRFRLHEPAGRDNLTASHVTMLHAAGALGACGVLDFASAVTLTVSESVFSGWLVS